MQCSLVAGGDGRTKEEVEKDLEWCRAVADSYVADFTAQGPASRWNYLHVGAVPRH